MTRDLKAIILTGMMGCGKTTVGQKLAETLGRAFYDCDREVEKAGGKSIAEMFQDDGEQAFRALEKKTALGLLARDNAVIALGGGAFMDAETRARIKTSTTSIWLSGAGEVFYRRAQRAGARPLLGNMAGEEEFLALYRSRATSYRLADITVANDHASVQNTVDEILTALRVNDR